MSDPRYLKVEEVQAEIQELLKSQVSMRREMMSQMVGSLYPSIMESEMNELMRWQDAISKRGT